MRLFVEKLSEPLIRDLKQKGIEARFYFIGEKSDQHNFLNEKMRNESYDACMLFFQKDLPAITGTNSHWKKAGLSDSKREHLLEIKLFGRSRLINPIWEANIKVDISPLDEKNYSNISLIHFKKVKTK